MELITHGLPLWMVDTQICGRESFIHHHRDILARKLVGFVNFLVVYPIHVILEQRQSRRFLYSSSHDLPHVFTVKIALFDNSQLEVHPVEFLVGVVNSKIHWHF